METVREWGSNLCDCQREDKWFRRKIWGGEVNSGLKKKKDKKNAKRINIKRYRGGKFQVVISENAKLLITQK